MDTESLNSCSICLDEYLGDVRPHCLPCGHNLCGSCLEKSMKGRILMCPQCKRTHRANSINEFPIDYGMEALISELRNLRSSAIPEQKKADSQKSQSRHKWQEFLSDQKESLRNLIKTTDEMQADVLLKHDDVNQRISKHEVLNSKLSEFIRRSNEIIGEFKSEANQLTETLKERDELQKRANATISRFDHVTSTKDIVTGSDEIAECHESLDGWTTKTLSQLSSTTNIDASKMLIRETIDALLDESSEDKDEASGGINGLSASSLPVWNVQIPSIRGKQIITANELKSKSSEVMNLVMKGQLYATQNMRGHIRSAKIIQHNNRLFLHYLQDKEPPRQAYTIQYSELIDCLNKDSVSVFMDLSWEGSIRGRLHILLSPDTPLARHFRCLCCGDSGPSYAQSTLIQMDWKGHNTHERISGGDYEKRDGSGGAPLMKGLNPRDGIYKRTYEEGVIYTRYNDVRDGPKISQFCILSGKGNSGIMYGVFGRVQEGLQTVKQAAKLNDIRNVIIDDCGVILNF